MQAMGKGKEPPSNKNEIVGVCTHHHCTHWLEHITRDKAHRKCVKQFNNRCKHFIPIRG
jgi:hypothetical protein